MTFVAEQTSRELLVVGGPNGAGKTTWVSRARQVHEDVLYLSADQIATELSPAKPEAASIRAGREFLRRLRIAVDDGEEMIVESTLSGRGLARFLVLARDQGYRIVIVYIFLHGADLCVRRVRARVRRGGHDVPEADIIRRYGRSKTNFWTLYRPLADEWHLYFNGGDFFEMVASGDAETMAVHNETRLRLFRDIGS